MGDGKIADLEDTEELGDVDDFEYQEHPCLVDFSKIRDVVVGRVRGRNVTFGEYIGSRGFPYPLFTPEQVYWELVGDINYDNESYAKGCEDSNFKDFREATSPEVGAVKAISDAYLKWS